jgi:hypothetical protein
VNTVPEAFTLKLILDTVRNCQLPKSQIVYLVILRSVDHLMTVQVGLSALGFFS